MFLERLSLDIMLTLGKLFVDRFLAVAPQQRHEIDSPGLPLLANPG